MSLHHAVDTNCDCTLTVWKTLIVKPFATPQGLHTQILRLTDGLRADVAVPRVLVQGRAVP